jgi:hypothetical protein
METKLAGYCGVDSGQIMVIDPCYALKDEFDDLNGNYRSVCNVTLSDDGYGEFSLPANGYNQSIGVVTSSGYGDGCYPVYVDVNNDNRVVALHIYFDGLELELDYA